MKKIVLVLFLLALTTSISGCYTVKEGAAGMKRDTVNLWDNIKEADEWFKENMW